MNALFNTLNPDKKGKLSLPVFHVFFQDENTASLFDTDMLTPVIWGSKTLVLGYVKKLGELIGDEDYQIIVNFYIKDAEGHWKCKFQYKGLAKNVIILRV